ncbi:MAG: hypothetical protein ABIQ39_11550, partial [Ilumatobacteraceae bacterium]
PAFVEPTPEATPAVAAGGDAAADPDAVGSGAGGVASAYESKIPAHLRDRSTAALAKWKANH